MCDHVRWLLKTFSTQSILLCGRSQRMYRSKLFSCSSARDTDPRIYGASQPRQAPDITLPHTRAQYGRAYEYSSRAVTAVNCGHIRRHMSQFVVSFSLIPLGVLPMGMVLKSGTKMTCARIRTDKRRHTSTIEVFNLPFVVLAGSILVGWSRGVRDCRTTEVSISQTIRSDPRAHIS